MKKFRKSISLMLVLCLSMIILAGCNNHSTKAPKEENVSEADKTEQENSEVMNTDENEGEKIIIDQVGHEIKIPRKINRVVISSLWPLPSVYCLFQGSSEGLVGMHPASKSAAIYSLLPEIAPEVKDVETNFVQNGEMNVEELMKLKPDVVFGSKETEYEMVTKAGIPYVQFVANPTGDGNAIESVGSWLKLLGEIFDKEDRADEIMNEGYQVLEEIEKVVNNVAEKDKVRALIIFKYDDGQLAVAGKGHFGDFWLNSAGAINVAGEVQGPKDVNMEQIYTWNPDKIFLTNFTSHMPEDFYENTIDNHDWSNIKAVQNKEVYKIPLGMYRWYPPSSDTPLMLKWMALKNYPELFKDLDINQEVREYYEKFYEKDLTDEQIENIFNPSREAAGGV
ncbi:MAG: ABC transporter substrate-binding protein [Tissierellia bacterium]|nr:ABC transporter substrate-binding protein [Tissierellia bacterium]